MKKIVNKIKRNIKVVVALAAILPSVTSCEDQLEITPKSVYTEGNFYKTTIHAELGVKGIYDVLAYKETYSQELSMVYPLDNDVVYFRGTGFSNDKRRIAHYGLNPNTIDVQKTWLRLYQGVNYANTAIKSIQEMDLFTNGTDEEKGKLGLLLAEAKFMRAFLYFDLVRHWGEVPLITSPQSATDNLKVKRASRSELYDQMVKDLTEARDVLPKVLPTTNDRAHWGAAQAYLVRILTYRAGYYLDLESKTMKRPANYKEYYKQAAQEAMALKSEGIFGVLDDYETVFKNLSKFIQDPKENIFEIALYNVAQAGIDDGVVGTYNSPKTHQSSPFGRANAFLIVQPDFIKEYTDEDKRRDVSVANFEIDKNGNQKALKKGKPMYPGKWRRDWIAEAPLNKNNTNVNWCTMRYADVLLMMAEAINETRDDLPAGVTLSDGFEAINEVRNRAGLGPVDAGLNVDDFREAIKKERKLELACEGWRKYDLIRWNEIKDALDATQKQMETNYPKASKAEKNGVGYVAGMFFTANKHELLPIPAREMAENENLGENNPGY